MCLIELAWERCVIVKIWEHKDLNCLKSVCAFTRIPEYMSSTVIYSYFQGMINQASVVWGWCGVLSLLFSLSSLCSFIISLFISPMYTLCLILLRAFACVVVRCLCKYHWYQCHPLNHICCSGFVWHMLVCICVLMPIIVELNLLHPSNAYIINGRMSIAFDHTGRSDQGSFL